jgi:signal recognition particle subunit SRP14
VLLQSDPFLSELTNMYERSTEKGSVWVTMKRCELLPPSSSSASSMRWAVDLGGIGFELTPCFYLPASMKCEARLKKMANKGEEVEYRCLVRATDGKKNISTAVLITVSLAIFHCN